MTAADFAQWQDVASAVGIIVGLLLIWAWSR